VGEEALSIVGRGRTHIILNAAETITAAFIKQRDFRIPAGQVVDTLRRLAGADLVDTIDSTAIITSLFKDSQGSNLFLVGYAYQKGLIPVTADLILRAIELNGAGVAMNKASFGIGRLAAHDPQAVAAMMPGSIDGAERRLSETLDEVIARRTAYLVQYQNERYAERYRGTVARIREAERRVMGVEGRLADTVARNLFKLMAYKDEYEVARLHSHKGFRKQLRQSLAPGARLSFHLAPPFLPAAKSSAGEPLKMEFGAWVLPVFSVLARLRGLRGTAFDPFGYMADRRIERRLIRDYEASLRHIGDSLTPERFDTALAFARIPEDIRGFGPVKQRSIDRATARGTALEHLYRSDGGRAAQEPQHPVPTSVGGAASGA
jgi:indolepyruvate ferredoxin oxidoreductase